VGALFVDAQWIADTLSAYGFRWRARRSVE
jgi:hypothetical protein